MKKLIFLLPLFLFTMCTEKYQEKIEALERQRDSVQAQITTLQTEVAVKEERIRFTETKLKELEDDKQRIVKKYSQQINDLSKKTPQQVHEEFNEVYPTTEEPLLNVAQDQIRAALETKIEKEQCEETLQNAEQRAESLTVMVGIQKGIIENKDDQISLILKDKTLLSESYETKIAMCEDTIKKNKRRDFIQKAGIIGVAIAAILVF